MPIEAQVSPLPGELTRPPVTKMCLAIAGCASVGAGCASFDQFGGGAASPAERAERRLAEPRWKAARLYEPPLSALKSKRRRDGDFGGKGAQSGRSLRGCRRRRRHARPG